MIGLDTNLLVRLLARDDQEQADRVKELIQAQCSPKEPGFIGVVVLCELVWVLTAGYGYRRAQVAEVLQGLLMTRNFQVEEPGLVARALSDFRQGNADFSDCLLGRANRARGCSTTYTFDRKAARLGDFTLL